jgi:hypothetical protein
MYFTPVTEIGLDGVERRLTDGDNALSSTLTKETD